jgi:hypothetical protein
LAVAELNGGSGGIAREGHTTGFGAGAFKRRGLPSEDAHCAGEGSCVLRFVELVPLRTMIEVKHYDADGMYVLAVVRGC